MNENEKIIIMLNKLSLPAIDRYRVMYKNQLFLLIFVFLFFTGFGILQDTKQYDLV